MNTVSKTLVVVVGLAAMAVAATAVVTAGASNPAPQAARPSAAAAGKAPASQAPGKAPASQAPVRKTAPPLPNVGFAPVRPIDIVRATYDFAAQHPEILKYVPCYCGCGAQGHSANESCFIARRDAKGNVLEWDTHGFGCTICVDVAREAMQLYSSGADVVSIRSAIEKKWTPGNAAGKTPTPHPPKK